MKLIPSLNTLPSGATVPSGGQITQPRSCAVIPNKTVDPEGFIDTRNVLPGIDRQVFVSVTAVREMGRLIGLVDPSEVEQLTQDFAATEQQLWDRLAELYAELEYETRLREARELVADEDD